MMAGDHQVGPVEPAALEAARRHLAEADQRRLDLLVQEYVQISERLSMALEPTDRVRLDAQLRAKRGEIDGLMSAGSAGAPSDQEAAGESGRHGAGGTAHRPIFAVLH